MPSSVIDTISYDREKLVLRIRFQSGSIYEYEKVQERIYDAMKKAHSKGVFFNNYIKGKYSFLRLK